MKEKLLGLVMMLLTCLSADAQIFAPEFEEGKYSEGYWINVLLRINGDTVNDEMKNSVELAAFVDGECRDVIPSKQNPDGFEPKNNFFMLRVMGDEDDESKDVTFKVVYNGIVYKMKTTLPFVSGESTYQPIPLVLNIDMVTGVGLPDSIVIQQKLGTTYDLSEILEYWYGKDGYKPLYESSLDTAYNKLINIWDYSNSSDYFSIKGDTLTTIAECEKKYLGLSVNVVNSQTSEPYGDAFTLVTIRVPVVPVTSITTKSDTYECWNGDNLYNELANEITVLPEDATDNSYVFEQKSGPEGGMNEKGTFEQSGTYVITIKSVSNPDVTKDITVTVKEHVSYIYSKDITVELGKNVFDAIKENTVIMPANAANKELTFSNVNPEYIDSNGIALKRCTNPKINLITITSVDNPQASDEIVVLIVDTVTAITATPDTIIIPLGTNVADYIRENVKVEISPSTAEQSAWEIVIPIGCESYFSDSVAVELGNFYLAVVSLDNHAIATYIYTKIVEPVELTCDSVIEMSNLTYGMGDITVTKGSEIFVPSLVSVETDTNMAEVTLYKKENGNMEMRFYPKKIGTTYFNVLYDGKLACQGTLMIGGALLLENGWTWLSNFIDNEYELKDSTGAYKYRLFARENKILEMRSQNQLLLNDSTYGVFGQIELIDAATMYKVKANVKMILCLFGELIDSTQYVYNKGYTWIAYPIIGNHTFDYFAQHQLLANAEDGDAIIGKKGFAEFDGQKWTASDGFMLETGLGYIYYQKNAGDKALYFGNNYVEEESNAKADVNANAKANAKANVWKYNASVYSENMCIVARINGIQASEKYSVGAFVNGECRGMGTFVNGEVMFINVAGKSGEKVSFKLYNSETEEYTEIPETFSYTMRKGSLSSPASLSAHETTGIQTLPEVKSEELKVKSVNLSGQVVNDGYKGIVIKNGRKFLIK